MRWRKPLPILGAVLWWAAASGQTVVQSPAGLSTVPKGATRAEPFWQHLVVGLTRNPTAGDTLAVELPEGIAVADADSDGSVADEITLDSPAAAGTGYRSAAGTTADRIVLRSPTGGVAGSLHVQFPVTTQASPTRNNPAYGLVSFANTGERSIPAGTLALSYAEAYGLSLATFSRLFVDGVADTTTNPQGDRYPAVAAAAFGSGLPDLLSDQEGSLAGTRVLRAAGPFGDRDDGNDTVYRFWFSRQDSLARVDTTSATRAVDNATGQPARVQEGSTATIAFEVSSLSEGTYYLYLTCDLTGRYPLARSRGIAVRHRPAVLSVGQFQSNDADYLDSGLLLDFDHGQPGPAGRSRDRVDLPFSVVDYDDSAYVRLFYATADTLDTTFAQTTGSAPSRRLSGLRNATDVDSTAGLREGKDSRQQWRIAPTRSRYVPAGDYYVYALVTDGKNLAIGRSAYPYKVRHSPYLAFDTRPSRTVATGGDPPERYYTISWNRDSGADGDIDRDDNATIALYYSDTDTFSVPGGYQALRGAAADSTRQTRLIKGGLTEDPDGRTDNQYVWDLWTYANPDSGRVLREGVPYCLYAVVTGGSVSRLVRWDDEAGQARRLTFLNRPYLRPQQPLAPIAVDGRTSFEVSWLAKDLDNQAGVWVVLTGNQAGQLLGQSTTWQALSGDGSADWIANSSDGSLAGGRALVEDRVSRHAVRPYRMVRDAQGGANPLKDGDYWVYLVIDEAGGAAPAAASTAKRAAGLVTVEGLGPDGAAGLQSAGLEVAPAVQTRALRGDTARLELRPHTRGQAADVFACFLSLDTLYFRLVDQDTTKAGIQPFALASGLPGRVLADSARLGTDSTTVGKWLLDLVYFEQAGTSRFNGDVSLATFQLVSKTVVGTARVRIDNLKERQSAFYRQGALVAGLAPVEAGRIVLLPRATVSGQVRLQGRTSHKAQATFLMCDRNSTVPIADSLYRATNDRDSTRAGIQDTVDADGRFTLSQVPTGEYHLTVHVDQYLDGQVPDLRVTPGATITGADPVVLADGRTAAGFLLGGDVTGYVDTSGASLPDNQIDQLDVDYVASHFGSRVSAVAAARMADIDADSLVWVSDLNLVAANYGRSGVEPVYRMVTPGRPAARPRVRLVTASGPSDPELVVEVRAEGLEGQRAYGVRLLYDDGALSLRAHDAVAAFGDRAAVGAYRQTGGELDMGGSLLGPGQGIWGDACLARVRFARIGTSADARVSLAAAELAGPGLERAYPELDGALPSVPVLLPNCPNPFNPATSIRVLLTRGQKVQLEVYSATGQRVRSLAEAFLETGAYAFAWDGRDDAGLEVGSGVYFARLRAGPTVAVRKMLLLR